MLRTTAVARTELRPGAPGDELIVLCAACRANVTWRRVHACPVAGELVTFDAAETDPRRVG